MVVDFSQEAVMGTPTFEHTYFTYTLILVSKPVRRTGDVLINLRFAQFLLKGEELVDGHLLVFLHPFLDLGVAQTPVLLEKFRDLSQYESFRFHYFILNVFLSEDCTHL